MLCNQRRPVLSTGEFKNKSARCIEVHLSAGAVTEFSALLLSCSLLPAHSQDLHSPTYIKE